MGALLGAGDDPVPLRRGAARCRLVGGDREDAPGGRVPHGLRALAHDHLLVHLPWVYIVKMVGLAGVTATAAEQIGYSIADVVAKAVFGVLIWAIAAKKSSLEEEGALLRA